MGFIGIFVYAWNYGNFGCVSGWAHLAQHWDLSLLPHHTKQAEFFSACVLILDFLSFNNILSIFQ